MMLPLGYKKLLSIIIIPISVLFLPITSADTMDFDDFRDAQDQQDLQKMPSITQPPLYAGVYFDVNWGYAVRDWEYSQATQAYLRLAEGSTAGILFGPFSHGKGGFTLASALGYQWGQYIAAEVGAVRFPTMIYYVPAGVRVGQGSSARFRGWMSFIALKLNVPVVRGFYLFAKLGAGSIANSVKFEFIPIAGLPQRGDYWAPITAFGMQYYINWNWSLNLQYLFVPGFARRPLDGLIRKSPAPDSYLITLGISYKITY